MGEKGVGEGSGPPSPPRPGQAGAETVLAVWGVGGPDPVPIPRTSPSPQDSSTPPDTTGCSAEAGPCLCSTEEEMETQTGEEVYLKSRSHRTGTQALCSWPRGQARSLLCEAVLPTAWPGGGCHP